MLLLSRFQSVMLLKSPGFSTRHNHLKLFSIYLFVLACAVLFYDPNTLNDHLPNIFFSVWPVGSFSSLVKCIFAKNHNKFTLRHMGISVSPLHPLVCLSVLCIVRLPTTSYSMRRGMAPSATGSLPCEWLHFVCAHLPIHLKCSTLQCKGLWSNLSFQFMFFCDLLLFTYFLFKNMHATFRRWHCYIVLFLNS